MTTQHKWPSCCLEINICQSPHSLKRLANYFCSSSLTPQTPCPSFSCSTLYLVSQLPWKTGDVRSEFLRASPSIYSLAPVPSFLVSRMSYPWVQRRPNLPLNHIPSSFSRTLPWNFSPLSFTIVFPFYWKMSHTYKVAVTYLRLKAKFPQCHLMTTSSSSYCLFRSSLHNKHSF